MPSKKHNQLDSDRHLSAGHVQLWPVSIRSKLFWKTVQKILEMRRGKLPHYQHKQQREVENFFRWSNIHIHSYYHNPDGTWNIKLVDDLHASKWKKRIIFLHPSIIMPVDISQTFPNWINRTWIFAMRAMDILARNILGDRVEKFNWWFDPSKKDSWIEEELLNYGTISWYTIHTTMTVQEKIYWGESVEVFIVKSATSGDLHDVLKNSDSDTTLVMSGHGNYHWILLTDGFIQNKDIQNPHNKLRALIQHTCGDRTDENGDSFGKDFATEIYGWERFSSPVDFLLHTLRKKQ